jgi:hypothetical protein
MLLRGGDHRLEQLSVRLLDIRLPGELRAGIAQTQRQRIADPLQIPGREHPRAADGAHLPLEPAAREGRGECLAEGALEPPDLAAQVVARAALGRLDRGRYGRLVEGRRCDHLAVFEHLGHSVSSRTLRRRSNSKPSPAV